MTASNGWNMYVFRDGRDLVAGPSLVSKLAETIRASVSDDASRNHLVEALLRAGELECALADERSPDVDRITAITDLLATALVCTTGICANELLARLPQSVPPQLAVSPPEGFAYYALHPSDYAALTERLPINSKAAAVVGIRSIGTTLSAIVLAACRKRGLESERITVRPTGHPYDRRCNISGRDLDFVRRFRDAGAEFLVADEGPGMSGSSFLSVADALAGQGVHREGVTLLCSREPDVSRLRAPNAQDRWNQHRYAWVWPNSFLPPAAKVYAGGGHWRRLILSSDAEWPESWIQMERLKFLSPDHQTLYKFEGFGRFGRAVHDRAVHLNSAGFGPPVAQPSYGFGVYPMVTGRLLTRTNLNTTLLRRIGGYCALRARAFPVACSQPENRLAVMARFNFREEFGTDLRIDDDLLCSPNPVITDSRMHPHEWLLSTAGEALKLDGTTHGDDHFFPGPTDIAWDLAGAVVEWNMDAEASDLLLTEFERALDESDAHQARRRLPAFVLAYSIFRMAYNKMAAHAVMGSGEELRLCAAYKRYRDYVSALVLQEPIAA